MKRLLVCLGALCLLALLVTLVVLAVRFQRQAQAVRQFIATGPANLVREEAAARQAGIPLDASQLQKPLPPPGQNAAPLYVKLTKLLQDKPLNLPKYAERMDAFHSYTPAQIATIRKLLADRQDVMTLVYQAADKPQCVFVRDWNKGLKLEFPEYPRMREAVRLLNDESYLLARDGHYKEAITNQRLGFHVAEHAASDHILLAYLVGNSSEAITLGGMQSIMAFAGPNAAVEADIDRVLTTSRPRLALRDALRNEPAAMEPVFQQLHLRQNQGIGAWSASIENLTSGKDMVPVSESPSKTVSAPEQKGVSDMIDGQYANYLSDMRRIIAAFAMPEPNRHSEFAAVLNPSAQNMKTGDRAISFLLMPDLLKLDDDERRIHARESVTMAAGAILAEKAKTGTFPAKLPPGFTDPFTNKPLQYRREGNTGFVVYSVGPTGHFDGGRPGEKTPGSESVFRYPTQKPIPAP